MHVHVRRWKHIHVGKHVHVHTCTTSIFSNGILERYTYSLCQSRYWCYNQKQLLHIQVEGTSVVTAYATPTSNGYKLLRHLMRPTPHTWHPRNIYSTLPLTLYQWRVQRLLLQTLRKPLIKTSWSVADTCRDVMQHLCGDSPIIALVIDSILN